MSDKRLTVILYGCDRAIWRGGPVDLRIDDVFAAGGPRPLYEGRSEEATIDLRLQLPFDAGQVYAQLQKSSRLQELERALTEEKAFAWLLSQSTVDEATS